MDLGGASGNVPEVIDAALLPTPPLHLNPESSQKRKRTYTVGRPAVPAPLLHSLIPEARGQRLQPSTPSSAAPRSAPRSCSSSDPEVL
jgi:hypothetical protein